MPGKAAVHVRAPVSCHALCSPCSTAGNTNAEHRAEQGHLLTHTCQQYGLPFSGYHCNCTAPVLNALFNSLVLVKVHSCCNMAPSSFPDTRNIRPPCKHASHLPRVHRRIYKLNLLPRLFCRCRRRCCCCCCRRSHPLYGVSRLMQAA